MLLTSGRGLELRAEPRLAIGAFGLERFKVDLGLAEAGLRRPGTGDRPRVGTRPPSFEVEGARPDLGIVVDFAIGRERWERRPFDFWGEELRVRGELTRSLGYEGGARWGRDEPGDIERDRDNDLAAAGDLRAREVEGDKRGRDWERGDRDERTAERTGMRPRARVGLRDLSAA